MIVLCGIGDLEYHRHLWIKIFNVEFGEVVFGIEDEPVSAAGQRFFNQKERFHAAVFIGPGMTQLGPRFIRVLNVQMNRDAACGRTARDVKYMRRDCAHFESGVYILDPKVNKKIFLVRMQFEILNQSFFASLCEPFAFFAVKVKAKPQSAQRLSAKFRKVNRPDGQTASVPE